MTRSRTRTPTIMRSQLIGVEGGGSCEVVPFSEELDALSARHLMTMACSACLHFPSEVHHSRAELSFLPHSRSNGQVVVLVDIIPDLKADGWLEKEWE
jgi:hypothetical protein